MDQDQEDRERSLELLRAAHSFPGPFQFRVVAHPGAEERVLAAITAVAGSRDAIGASSVRPSRNGTYASVRVEVTLPRAEAVLEVYRALRTVEGVITVF